MEPTGAARLSRIPSWVRTAVAVLAFAGVALWLTGTTWDNVVPSRQDAGFLTDFRDAIYYPVVALTDGENPYEPSEYYRLYPVGQEFPLYSPVHLALHLPVAALSLADARAVYFGLNIALMLVLANASLRLAGYRSSAAAILTVGTLLLLSGPGKADLRNGEPTLIIVLAAYLALSSRPARAGWSALGLAVALAKPNFGLPLAVVMLCRRRVRAVVLGVAAATIVSAVVAIPLAHAAGGVGDLFHSLRRSLDVTSSSPQSRLGTSLRMDAGNTLARATGLRPSEVAATVVGLVLLAIGAWAAFRLHQRDPGSDRSELAVTLACLIVIVPFFRVAYDLLLLTWPILLLLRRRPRDALWPSSMRTVLAVLLIVPVADPMSWSFVRDVLGRTGPAATLLGPTARGLYLLGALLICCFAALRPVPRRAVVAS